MTILDDFFRELDARWTRAPSNPSLTLHVIGSTALMMTVGMRTGTTDSDIAALVRGGYISHEDLLTRFRSAVDLAAMSARADDLPRIIEHFHRIERDELGISPTVIELPDHLDQ